MSDNFDDVPSQELMNAWTRKQALFFYSQVKTTTEGLDALNQGDYAAAQKALHIIRAGAAHKIATEYAFVQAPDSEPAPFAGEGEPTSAERAAFEGLRNAIEQVQAVYDESPLASPYLESLVVLINGGLFADTNVPRE